jgi:hypothetical protein
MNERSTCQGDDVGAELRVTATAVAIDLFED